ncbi:MAG: adenylyltransferase/cytidyltransferase family protein [Desulfosporosinus sp.]|nr:adenylyltransferase/cytidyltransferase family protein [Desulfosporosinus sp.]
MDIPPKKYAVGYTAGVFDLFHIGHLNVLRRAKELCEFLIVGVNTDELVQEYKNKKPVIPFEERVAIVESICYVDRVVGQSCRDKLSALNDYKFDVLVVGDDWKGSLSYMKAEKELREKGITTVYIPYTQNTSSTLLRGVLHSF